MFPAVGVATGVYLQLQRRIDSMRVLVVGAGIIGSIYGWALAESGHRVVHLVRAGRAVSLRKV